MIQVETTLIVNGKQYAAEVGKATELYLGYEDHGLFMLDITMEYPLGGEQGLARCISDLKVIKDILTVFGVCEWSHIKGQSVYVLKEKDSLNSLILGFVSLDAKRSFLFD